MAAAESDVTRYLQAPEGARIEFKEAKGGFHFDRLVEYVVALANAGGGKIILGVTDQRPRRVVGTAAFAEPGRTEAGLFERLHHRVPMEEYVHEGRRLLIVDVPSREPGMVWEDRGVAWSRAGDSLVPMTEDQRRLIWLECAPDFSAQLCPNANLSDLHPAAIADFRSRWAVRAGNDRIRALSDTRTLIDAELMLDGKLTYAALILFGTRSALGRHLARAEVVFEYRSSESPGPAQDRQEYREGFFLFHDRLWERIDLRNDKQSYQRRFFRIEIPTFDEKVAREAVLNAVCHREYRLEGSVFVRQYARRLEVVSPGGLPLGITAENILHEQSPRNRRLAEALWRCGFVERAGQGMDLIYERMIRQGKHPPDLSRSGPHNVFLTLHGTMTDEGFVKFLEDITTKGPLKIEPTHLVVLDLVHRTQSIPPILRPALENLRNHGVLESVGRGRGTRYLLSRKFYAENGESGIRSPYNSDDKGGATALLLKHIGQNSERGISFGELQQMIPILSRRQMQRLLAELRSGNCIDLRGTKKGARWYPRAGQGANPEQIRAPNSG